MTREALGVADAAFAVLKRADPRETFLQLGGLVATYLHDVAQRLGTPEAAVPALSEVLEFLRALQSGRQTRSPALDQMVAWLEDRAATG
jgi:hypothetical protein